jgi:SAM-dependent methyltransferase
MTPLQITTVACPLCNRSDGDKLFETRDYALKVSDQAFALRRCAGCGVGYLSPRPREANMGAFYPDSFYWMHENAAAPMTPEQLLAVRRPQLEAKADCLAALEPGRLLDIGAQKGDFLHWMQQKGWEVEGVEYSQSPVNLFGLPIRYGELLDMTWERAQFDCVTMWAVLEHVYHPGRYLTKVASLLRPGGKFIGLVTNLDSPQARYLKMDDYPRHLTIFTKGSLGAALRRNGFRVDRFWTDQRIFGGSMQGVLAYAVKRSLGYSEDKLQYELKDTQNPEAFCCEWRGTPNWGMKQVSRAGKLLTALPERVFDRMGKGFLLCWEATYVGSDA